MALGRGAPSSLDASRRTSEWYARAKRRDKRTAMQRDLFTRMYEELGDLYGRQWELAEARHIREECEELGLPMGYGRVGRVPVQLTWGTTAVFFRKPNALQALPGFDPQESD